MSRESITIVPLILGGLAFGLLARRGRFWLGIAAALVVVLGLWFIGQVLILDVPYCTVLNPCTFSDHWDNFYDIRSVFMSELMKIVAPFLVAILPARVFVLRGKTIQGIASGVGIIALWWVIRAVPLLTCDDVTGMNECEWAGVGFAVYIFIASIQAIAVFIISKLFQRSYRRSLSHAP